MFLFIFFFLFSFNSYSQIANSSIFPDTKTINPAAIDGRKDGLFLTTLSNSHVTKTIDIKASDGATADGKGESVLDLNSLSLFSGGKGRGPVK